MAGGGFVISETVCRPTSRWLGSDPDRVREFRYSLSVVRVYENAHLPAFPSPLLAYFPIQNLAVRCCFLRPGAMHKALSQICPSAREPFDNPESGLQMGSCESASLTRGLALARTATPNQDTCLQAAGQATPRQMRGLMSSYCI